MLRRSLILLAILLIAALSSCQSTDRGERQIKHVVLCWLKDSKPKTIEAFKNSVKTLSSIPSVINVDVGEITPSAEPVADNSFDIGFIISFKNKAGLDEYLVHPKHVEAVKTTLKPSLEKVIVYDFESN